MKLLIIGAGGHGKVAADVALAEHQWDSIIFLDNQYPVLKSVLGYPVVGVTHDLARIVTQEDISDVFVAIGNNKIRAALIKECLVLGVNLPNLIHPSAVVSRFANLQQAILIMPQVVVNAAALIGTGAILNTAAIIEHDCILHDCVHVSPNATLAGGVTIGRETWIGMGAVIKEKIHIGAHVMVGAGAAVIRDVLDNELVTGVPAQKKLNHQR